MIDFFVAIFSPSTWIQNNRYSATWDKKLNELMTEHKFVRVDDFHASIGGYTVWVRNHPYASFVPEGMNIRPKRATILRAYEKMLLDWIEQKGARSR